MGILNKITCLLAGLKDEYFTYQAIYPLRLKDSNNVGVFLNGEFSVFDLETKNQIASFKLEDKGSCFPDYVGNGSYCIITSKKDDIRVCFDSKTGKVLKRIQGKKVRYLFVGSSKIIVSKGGCFALLDENEKEIQVYDYLKFDKRGGVAQTNGKWGILDPFDGKELLPFIYDNLHELTDELMGVKYNGKWGILSIPKFEEVLPCKYDEFKEIRENLLPACLNKKWGYIDINTWHVAIPFTYKNVTPFSGLDAGVEQNARWGLINKYGEKLISCAYYRLFPLGFGYAVVAEKKTTTCKVIDYINKKCAYSSHETYSKIVDNGYRMSFHTNDYVYKGLINVRSGKIVVPARYSYVSDSPDYENGKTYHRVHKGSKWGVFCVEKYCEIVPCKYDYVGKPTDGLFTIKQNGQEGMYDSVTRKEIIPWKYGYCYLGATSKYVAVSSEGKKGLINRSNWEEVIPCECDDYYRISEDVIAFKKNNLWGLFDAKGKHIELSNKKSEIISDDKHSDVIPESHLKLSAETNQKSSNTTPKPAKKEIPAAKSTAKPAATEGKSREGTRTKYAVNDTGSYGKGRMVEAVVNKYVELNPKTTVQKLKEVFPERLQGSNLIKSSTETITDMKRYYESALPNGEKFYISNQWGTQTDGFVEYVNNNVDGITVTKL